MKKTILTMSLLTLGLMAADFSQLTTEELTAMRGTVAVEDRADFRAEMQSRVALMTAEEQAAFRESRQAAGQKLRDGSGAGQSKGEGKGNAGENMPTFADFDTDGDGAITEAELTAARTDRMTENAEAGKLLKNVANAPEFSTLDTNADGTIDATEFTAHQTEQRETKADNRGQGTQQGMGSGQMNKNQMRQGQGMGQGQRP